MWATTQSRAWKEDAGGKVWASEFDRGSKCCDGASQMMTVFDEARLAGSAWSRSMRNPWRTRMPSWRRKSSEEAPRSQQPRHRQHPNEQAASSGVELSPPKQGLQREGAGRKGVPTARGVGADRQPMTTMQAAVSADIRPSTRLRWRRPTRSANGQARGDRNADEQARGDRSADGRACEDAMEGRGEQER